MSEMIERVADGLVASFKDEVAAGRGLSFDETGVSLPARQVWERYARAAISAMPPMDDLMAATVSCSGLEITIQCNDYDVRDRLMDFLTGDDSAAPTQVGAA